jgi:hypothetical protein
MKKLWRILSTAALAAALSINIVAPAFAADGDIVDTKTGTLYPAASYDSNTVAYNTLIDKIIIGATNEFTYEFGGNKFKFNDYSSLVTALIGQGETPLQAKTDAANQLTGSPAVVNAIDTTKSVAIKGLSINGVSLFGDVFYRVYLLSGVAPSSVTSLTVTNGTATTVLPYNTTDGNYEKDIVYTGTLPTSVSVVLTTAAGAQTVTVPVN